MLRPKIHQIEVVVIGFSLQNSMFSAHQRIINKDVAEIIESSDQIELFFLDLQFSQQIAFLDHLEVVVMRGWCAPLGRVIVISREGHL